MNIYMYMYYFFPFFPPHIFYVACVNCFVYIERERESLAIMVKCVTNKNKIVQQMLIIIIFLSFKKNEFLE